MHGDLEALDVVCMHYRTEYSCDALRKAKTQDTATHARHHTHNNRIVLREGPT
jgi:hypothetical protein